MSLQMKALSLRATNDDIAARASSSRRRRRNHSFRRRRQRRLFCGTEASSSETKSKEEEIVIKVFLALRPLDGFPDALFDLYPRRVLHHATVLEMTTSRDDDYYEEEEEEEEEKRLQYLVDFAPKHPLALETAFKLLVLRTSVEGVIRRDVVERKFTRRYASSSGMDLIGEVKRKSVLDAVATSIRSSTRSNNNSGSENSTDDDNIREAAAYDAVDRVVAAEFYSLCDWRNLALCKNDCRDFHRAFVRYLGEEE